jgi:excisionase family DNA binding protein
VTPPLPLAAASQRLRGKPGRPRTRLAHSVEAPVTLSPRLLTVSRAAAYLGVGRRTIEKLIAAGTLPRVRVPMPTEAGELRKTLVDRDELDRLVTTWRETP